MAVDGPSKLKLPFLRVWKKESIEYPILEKQSVWICNISCAHADGIYWRGCLNTIMEPFWDFILSNIFFIAPFPLLIIFLIMFLMSLGPFILVPFLPGKPLIKYFIGPLACGSLFSNCCARLGCPFTRIGRGGFSSLFDIELKSLFTLIGGSFPLNGPLDCLSSEPSTVRQLPFSSGIAFTDHPCLPWEAGAPLVCHCVPPLFWPWQFTIDTIITNTSTIKIRSNQQLK